MNTRAGSRSRFYLMCFGLAVFAAAAVPAEAQLLYGGLVGAVILGLGRALGETMAVTMVIGNRHDIGLSVLQPAYTMAAAIANEFSEATTNLYLSALFEVGLILFVITVVVNALARLLIWRVARGTAVGSRAL